MGKRIARVKSSKNTSCYAKQKTFKYYMVASLVMVAIILIFFASNTNFNVEKYDLYVSPTQTSEPTEILANNDVIFSSISFKVAAWVLQMKHIEPGLYEIGKDWTNFQIIKKLQTKPDAAASVIVKPYLVRKNVLFEVCKNLDIKHTALEEALLLLAAEKEDDEFDKESIYAIFLPDTLMIFKDAKATEVAKRLVRNYKLFWNEKRIAQADSIGLTPIEVSILSSIIYGETKLADEMPRIAGVYINRLNQGMRLQADPTLVFASGNTSIKRVWNKHKLIKSPYNTYRYAGLPPGPVMTAPASAIDAVLNFERHEFLYFSAKDDLSGYHDFSKTYDEHLMASSKYQKELNKRKIY